MNIKIVCLAIWFLIGTTTSLYSYDVEIPVSYKGRIRPMDAYAQLWLNEIYGAQQIKAKDRQLFSIPSGKASELLWHLHFLGHEGWDETPLFTLSSAELKKALGLVPTLSHFSYHQLDEALFNTRESNLSVIEPLIIHTFLSSGATYEKQELTSLSAGLWVGYQGDNLIILAAPSTTPWHFLKPGMVIGKEVRSMNKHSYRALADQAIALLSSLQEYAAFSKQPSINPRLSVVDQLENAGNSIRALPGRYYSGQWFSLKTLKTGIKGNFTAYSDEQFQRITDSYLRADEAFLAHSNTIPEELEALKHELTTAYLSIEGKPYQEADNKSLYYPSTIQLFLESSYYRYPLITTAIGLYLIAVILLILHFPTAGCIVLSGGFAIHTALLAMRWLILARPPVSNMFETVIYVPWIAMLIGFILYKAYGQKIILLTAGIASIILLTLLKVANLSNGMENVQAVLDSHYWLTIHVLMIVASYGIFMVNGLLGHLYLAMTAWKGKETLESRAVGKLILQTMFIGLALLIPGTILGGVWAAESWGRFWDWDPKESWAFISAAIYLIWVHAYHFRLVGYFGLAIGAVTGLMAISFTWYGVNYLLGTGFHTYGFGSGGEYYYYVYLVAELIFISVVLNYSPQSHRQH